NLKIGVNRSDEKERGGRKPPDGPRVPVDAPIIMLPDHLEQLARGKVTNETPLPETIQVEYELKDKKTTRKIRIPLRFNEKQATYEPMYFSGSGVISMDGEPMPVEIQPTASGRNWRILFPSGEQAFLGNFFVNSSDRGGRPVPILWLSPGVDPHRRLINIYL